MRRRSTRGSGHRGRGVGHDTAGDQTLATTRLRPLMAAAASLSLAACAAAARENGPPAPTPVATPASAAAATAAPDPRELMIDAATSMLGQPYRYGGAAPRGFAFSG